MKTLRTVHRTTKFALQNIWRNIWLSVATVMIFVLTLLTINILLTMHVLTDVAIANVEERIDVSVYFHTETSEKLMFAAREYLLGLSQVQDVEYVSADEALLRFTQKHQSNEDVTAALETVERNPFGGSLVVTARTPEDFPFILEALNNPQFVDEIRERDFTDHENIIAQINEVTAGMRLVALVLAGVFTLIAILIVLNSIRISIYTHREEIGIMRLVGAGNGFIRLPFVIEALLFSVVAGVIVAGIVLPSATAMEPGLRAFFGVADVGLFAYYWDHLFVIFGLQILGLSVLSVVSSAVAMRRYLKV